MGAPKICCSLRGLNCTCVEIRQTYCCSEFEALKRAGLDGLPNPRRFATPQERALLTSIQRPRRCRTLRTLANSWDLFIMITADQVPFPFVCPACGATLASAVKWSIFGATHGTHVHRKIGTATWHSSSCMEKPFVAGRSEHPESRKTH